MRVLMQSRKTLFSVPGGDTIQLIKTKEQLVELGVEVDISCNLRPALAGYDLVHLFNVIRPQETWTQAKNAIKQGVPYVISTIYVDYSEYEKNVRGGLSGYITKHLPAGIIEMAKIFGRAVFNQEFHRGLLPVLRGTDTLAREICRNAAALLPNSYSESTRLREDFNLGLDMRDKTIIVPNGFDDALFNPEISLSTGLDRKLLTFSDDCVLCVARIEGRKNQFKLVEAFHELPYRLLLIGMPAPNHKAYYHSILRDLSDNVKHVRKVPHDQLPVIYSRAKVHVLPSWFETTGLSSLEAAAMGCNIVVTRKGDTEEYFRDYAFYCDPGSINSIREMVVRAYNSPVNPEFSQFVRKNYTWRKAALETLRAYEKILG